MIVDGGQRLAIELGIPDDDAVGSHERDARADELAESIGFGIELGAGRRLAVRQRFRREARLADEGALDALVGRPAHRPGDEYGRDEQRQRGRHQRCQEEAGAKRHGCSTSL